MDDKYNSKQLMAIRHIQNLCKDVERYADVLRINELSVARGCITDSGLLDAALKTKKDCEYWYKQLCEEVSE